MLQREPPDPSGHRCCTQRTISVPGDVDYRSRQRHYSGSHDWISSISRRSRVEGWFGDLKDRSRVALTRGGFRVMRLCKSSVMLAIYAAATNLRLLDTWAARTGLDEPPALTQAHSATPHADSEESPPRPSREPPPGSL